MTDLLHRKLHREEHTEVQDRGTGSRKTRNSVRGSFYFWSRSCRREYAEDKIKSKGYWRGNVDEYTAVKVILDSFRIATHAEWVSLWR